jgi:pimeloyl-ACP methyl ester carboxylesterase
MGGMRRGWKIALGVIAALAVLVAVNAVVTSNETRSAEVTEPGGRILSLNGGDVQIVDRGPRDRTPIVLIHCFSCAINWWNRMMPLLDKAHRVIAIDLLGHGGSEKPDSGYSIPDQADLVAEALASLGVRRATVVGHSLGGGVAVALAEQSPDLVARLIVMDSRASPEEGGGLGALANLAFVPVIGQALWRIKPDFSIRKGLEVAFAPGFDIPDELIEDVRRMTYTAYKESHDALDDYTSEESLADRIRATHKPLLVIMGAEDQIIENPEATAAAYQRVIPWAFTNVIEGVGHSPNVEEPNLTSELVLGFAGPANTGKHARRRAALQKHVQNREGVRAQP